MPVLRVIGPGRAGLSLARALERTGWRAEPALGRGDSVARAATGVDLLVIATPDHAVAAVAAAVEPVATTVVAHLAGSLGLDVLAPHHRRASLHPLVPLPDPDVGAVRLAMGAWFAVAGDPLAATVVNDLGGRVVTVADADRPAHHAAAAIASNHLVALLGQVERVAVTTGVPLQAYLDLARAALADVADRGPATALTGPVSRGDTATVRRHLRALAPAERTPYLALAAAAARLAADGATGPGPTISTEPRRPGAVVDRVDDLRVTLDGARAAGLTVGLVPTMGALHEGHLSLVRRAAAECDVTAVTVFVNPLQFGPDEDLGTYPRRLEADVDLALGAGADLVFAPSVAEMYPEPVATAVDVGGLDRVFEGESRPGHFAGVATVVAKLFHAAGPCRAYFGEKDWQQLLVVRRLARDLSFPVDVVASPTVREPDGVACSSRNSRLSTDERRAARSLHRALLGGAALIAAGERQAAVVRHHLAEALGAEVGVTADYADVVRADDLTAIDPLVGDIRLLVAAHVGTTRLIDNLGVTVPAAAPPPPVAALGATRRSH